MKKQKIVNELSRVLAQGRRAFIWRWGVLRAGVAFAVVSALVDEVWLGERLVSSPWLSLFVRLLLYLPLQAALFGVLFGWMMWNWLSRFALPPGARNLRES